MIEAFKDVRAAYLNAWQLKRPLIAAHLAFTLVLGVVFVPLMAVAIRLALRFSGQPALADFDIAYFLLSPVGFICFLILAGLALFLFVLDLAFMMAVAARARVSGQVRVWDVLRMILPQAPTIIELGVRLTLRVLVIAVPFLAVAGGFYLLWMTEFDINYYLTFKPPEFLRAVVAIGVTLGAMVLVLTRQLVHWALVLPLVVFDGVAPKHSFATSAEKMRGTELRFVIKIAFWLGLSFIVGAVLLGALSIVAGQGVAVMGSGLKSMALVLLVFAGLGAALNLVITSITSGALASLIMARAGWPERSVTQPSDIPSWGVPVAVLVIAIAVVSAVTGMVQLAKVHADPDVQVIAHRGAAGAAPENTMAAIHQALEDGADWIEIDVQETADGQVVVIHDSDFMKISGVNLKIWDATMEDLQDIDIGSWFDPRFQEERTPLLSDVLKAAHGKAGVVIELKYYGHDEMLEQRVAEIVEATDMVEHVKIMSLKYEAVQKMRTLRPDWNIGLLASASLGRMWELDADFLAVNGAAASHRLVRETRNAGKDLFVWTINDPVSMTRMISIGVGGLITDEPAMARQVIAERRDLNMIERLVLGLAGGLGLDVTNEVYRDDSP